MARPNLLRRRAQHKRTGVPVPAPLLAKKKDAMTHNKLKNHGCLGLVLVFCALFVGGFIIAFGWQLLASVIG
jgi:hypothetical protein